MSETPFISARPSRLETSLPWALGLAFLALLIIECALWHPGFSYLDEGNVVALIQDWREGRALPFELFKGSLHRELAAGLCLLWGPSLWVFRLVSAGALALECLLLYRLGTDFFGRKAAAWAVACCLVSAQTFLRARSLLSFTLLPLELLALMALSRRQWSQAGSFLFGALAALLLADYEGAVLAVAVLALSWFFQRDDERPRALGALLGFSAMLALLVYCSWEGLGDHLLRRVRSLPQEGLGPLKLMGQFLKSFLAGGNCIAYLGVSGRAFLPAWALPGFVAGAALAWKRQRVLLGWLAVGLLPALTVAGAAEPNRILAAWPAICLLGGLGIAWLAGRLGALTLLILLLAGAAWEGSGYRASMAADYGHWYGESAAMQRLAQRFADRRLVNELGPEYSSQFRFLWPGPAAGSATSASALLAPPLFVLTPEFAPGLGRDAAGLKFEGTGDSQPPLAYLAAAPPPLSARLERISTELVELRHGLPRFAFRRHRDLLTSYLLSGTGDPWTRTAALEEALSWSSGLGELRPELLRIALKDPLASSSSLLWLSEQARRSGDSAFAARLCARALQIDPRRPCGP